MTLPSVRSVVVVAAGGVVVVLVVVVVVVGAVVGPVGVICSADLWRCSGAGQLAAGCPGGQVGAICIAGLWMCTVAVVVWEPVAVVRADPVVPVVRWLPGVPPQCLGGEVAVVGGWSNCALADGRVPWELLRAAGAWAQP